LQTDHLTKLPQRQVSLTHLNILATSTQILGLLVMMFFLNGLIRAPIVSLRKYGSISTQKALTVNANGWAGLYGDEASGNIGTTSAAGAWTGPEWSYDPLKEEIWGLGGFPVTIPDETPVWVGTNMNFLGVEPEITAGERFAVVVNVLGQDWTDDGRMAIFSIGADAAPPNPGIKFYAYSDQNTGGGGGSGHYGWVIRNYIWGMRIVVEFTSNTPPSITAFTYGSVLNANAKTLECRITDIDAADPNTAGIASAKLYYKVNDGADQTVNMSLASGTDTDGTWAGTIPAGYMGPGDVLTYSYEATDKAGATTMAAGGSFGYFVKQQDLLIFYNDDGSSYGWGTIGGYYTNLYSDYMYDVWVGAADGALAAELANQ